MRIVRATVIVTSPGRNFVTLKLSTEDGITGLGDATVNGRELAVAHYLRDHVCPLLIGMDAHRIEHIWHYLYRGAYWRRGPITMAAIAAVDTALWDIKGKVAGLPVYQLLGGASRDGIAVYGHANGETVAEVIDQVAGYVDRGYQAVRVQCAVPGVAGTYGVAKAPGPYEPADGRDRPTETVWSTEKYLDFVPGMIAAVRDRFGPELRLLHDVHHRLTPIEAARLGKSLEPVALYWLEDPTPAELQESFRLIRRHTTTPIAVGEVFNTLWDCEQLIREQLVDFIRASVVHAGGITHLRRIFSYAELYQVRTASHGATDLSPVCMSAALHLDLAVPNFGLQEYMPHTPETDAVFPHGYHFADGYLHTSEEPGLGVEIDERLATRYPYGLPGRCPLGDGTIHHW
ncbi:MAG: D-galactonate dehydratase family protein [Actinomycetota bacterium]|nr:D-galactonate dehydratase family protein [Actinomycetota bacterium]